MKRRLRVLPAIFFIGSLGLTLTVLASVENARRAPADSHSDDQSIPEIDVANFPDVAESFRQGDFETVETRLRERSPADEAAIDLLLGLYANAAGRNALALEHLRSADAYSGDLEDWRLWALADSAETLGQITLSRAVLKRLVTEFPDSPLAAPSIGLLASRAAEHGDWPGVLAIVEDAYDPGLDAETRERLAVLAWEAAESLGDGELIREAAIRLLVHHPLLASDMQVVGVFRLEDGSIPWLDFLSVQDLVRRSKSLLAIELLDSALETLELVPEAHRDISWHLTRARSLTAAKRGAEALEILALLDTETLDDRADLEWERARAAIEASTPRRGRGQVTAEQRAEMRAQAHDHLRQLVEAQDERFAPRALRVLFTDLLEEDRFEDAVSTLRKLIDLDPHDTTGARPLWGRGWKEYTNRNYSGAIGYWTELGALYPRSNYNRSGLYWSARGHEQLGNSERAQELYQAVVDVDFTDIYRRHALERLEQAVSTVAEDQVSEPWPVDESLERAELLHSLGLDAAALIEISAQVDKTDRRALEALRAKILAASGERRQSIIALRRAFPVLGTPHQSLAPEDARHMYYPRDFQELIEQHSRRQRLPSHLVYALIRQESAFDISARSWAGAQGLMQIMPATGKELARRLGLQYSTSRLLDPDFSVRLGTSYLRQVLEMFDGDEVLALAGYNAGPYRIKRLWRQAGSERQIDHFLEQLAYEETRNYVKRVLLYSDSYRRLYESAG